LSKTPRRGGFQKFFLIFLFLPPKWLKLSLAYAYNYPVGSNEPDTNGGKKMVTKDFAVKIDTELAELHSQIWSINNDILTQQDYIESTQSSRFMNDNDKASHIARHNEKIAQLIIQRKPLSVRYAELKEIYKQDPWTRAFLVINSNGHIHNTMECSTCFETTRFEWRVELSNDDEITIVEKAGEMACTVCYPSAPAEFLNKPTQIISKDQAEKTVARAEREAKRLAKIAKEKASAPTASGKALAIPSTYSDRVEYIKTERTAVSEFNRNYSYSKQEIVTHYYDGKPHTAESIAHQEANRATNLEICNIIADALASKHNVSFDEMWAKLTKKAKVNA